MNDPRAIGQSTESYALVKLAEGLHRIADQLGELADHLAALREHAQVIAQVALEAQGQADRSPSSESE